MRRVRLVPAARRALLAAMAPVLVGCAAEPLATCRVERRDFEHRVAAEGFLLASSAAEVKVPAEVRRSGRIVWMAADGKTVAAGDVVLQLDHYEMEQRLEEESAELASADVERRQTEVRGRSTVESVVTRRDLAGIELEHAERFRRDDPRVFSKSEMLESELDADLARARRGHAQELEPIEAERARFAVDLVGITQRKRQIEVDLARRSLAALEVTAPSAGVLLWDRDWRGETPKIGEQVFRGQSLAEIPDLSRLDAEVFVLEADGGGLREGLEAEVVVEAHPERSYRAAVARIDPVAKRRIRGSPVQYFGVTLELDALDVEAMKPGQRVVASIVVARADDALLLPRQALFNGEEGFFVYLARDGEFLRRDVAIGALAPGLAVVAGGLDEGDVVALEAPATRRGPGPGETRGESELAAAP